MDQPTPFLGDGALLGVRTGSGLNHQISKAAMALVTEQYGIKLAHKDNYSDEHLRTYGLFTTGDAQLDKVMNDQPVYLVKTVMDLFELYRRGVTFRIDPHDQTKYIYECVSNYLKAAKFSIDSQLNAGKLDLDMLLDMDAFASKIYDHAVQHFDNQWQESALVRSLFGMRIANRARIADPTVVEDRKDWRHESYSTVFVTKLGGI